MRASDRVARKSVNQPRSVGEPRYRVLSPDTNLDTRWMYRQTRWVYRQLLETHLKELLDSGDAYLHTEAELVREQIAGLDTWLARVLYSLT